MYRGVPSQGRWGGAFAYLSRCFVLSDRPFFVPSSPLLCPLTKDSLYLEDNQNNKQASSGNQLGTFYFEAEIRMIREISLAQLFYKPHQSGKGCKTSSYSRFIESI